MQVNGRAGLGERRCHSDVVDVSVSQHDGAHVLARTAHLLQRRVEMVGVLGKAGVDDGQAVGATVDDVPVDVARAGAPDAGCDLFHGAIVSRSLMATMPAVTRAMLASTTKKSSGACSKVCGTSRTGKALAARPAPTSPR